MEGQQQHHHQQELGSLGALLEEALVLALDLSGNTGMLNDPAGVQQLAAALPPSPQLSALRELRLARCGLQGAGELCSALQAATQMRSLTLLDLSYSHGCAGALAPCLRASPHLRSLQQLLLAGCSIHSGDACTLADGVVDARLPLVALDLRHNFLDDQGAAAWAATLSTATCLSGLEELDLRRNKMTEAGVSQLADALQAATHLRRVRRLSLLPRGASPACAERVARLLQAALHQAASLQDLDLSRRNLSGDAMALVDDAVLAGGAHLLRLTRLDLGCHGNGISADAIRQLCTALVVGTQLMGLQDLCLAWSDLGRAACGQLVKAFVAATHLSGLLALRLNSDARLAGVGLTANLLQAAPHLRGLTTLQVRGVCRAALRSALELLPALRAQTITNLTHDAAGALGLAAALRHTPCTSPPPRS